MGKNLVTLEEALSASREEIAERYATYVNPGMARLLSLLGVDRKFVRATGAYVFDEHGQQFTDFLGGFGSLNLGHNHSEVLEAFNLVDNIPNVLHVSMGTMPAALAETLAALAPGDLSRVFFCHSGAEAVEASLKLARICTQRTRLLYCRNSFHGKTMGALSVTGRAKYQQPFEPLVPHCHAVPYGDIDAVENELRFEEYAAFIVEPIQGEAGMVVPPNGYLKAVSEICRQTGTVFLLDEVQTGLCRTGKVFGVEYEDVRPDAMALAKSLGGGVVPLGACIADPELWSRGYGSLESCNLHTSTLGGNARACAIGLKTIEILMRDNFAERAMELGEHFMVGLSEIAKQHDFVLEVRGKGLMIGVEFRAPESSPDVVRNHLAALVAHDLFEEHHIISAYALSNPNVLRIEPPLTISRDDIDHFLEALNQVLSRSPMGLAARVGWDYLRHHLSGLFGS